MEVKHIDKNTIRVRIDKEELAQRGLKVLDLLGNKEMIQHFFYSILAEVDSDHSFANNSPVSFQIMPSRDGLDLLISKEQGNDPVENFRKMLEGDGDDDAKSEETDSDLERINRALKSGLSDFETEDLGESEQSPDKKIPNKTYYQYRDLGDLIELAQSLKVDDLASSLYLYQGNYFLKLNFLDEDYLELEPKDAWAIANEYGKRISENQMRLAQNQGKCIFERDALGNLNRYFN